MLQTKKRANAEARRRQRAKQRIQQPAKFEDAKLSNRMSTAKHDEKKRIKRLLMSKEERVADLRLKAQAKRQQRMKKKMVILELLR